jgi:hypothetical protein
MVTPIELAVLRLRRALSAADLCAPAPAVEQDAVVELEREISPWALPDDLKAFWSSFDPFSLPLHGPLEYTTPRGAREVWDILDDFGYPRNVAYVAFEQQEAIAIEVSESTAGGPLWMWYTVQGDFRFVAPDLPTWIDLQAEMLEEGDFQRTSTAKEQGVIEVARIDFERYRQRLAHRLGLTSVDQLPEVPEDPGGWPAHWVPGGT